MSKTVYLDPEKVVEIWGDGFKPVATSPNVHFTETSVLVELKRTEPLTVLANGEKTKTLTFEEPDVNALKAMDNAKGEVSKVAALIKYCAGLPEASVNKIKASDFMVLSQVVAGFLSISQQTTGTLPET